MYTTYANGNRIKLADADKTFGNETEVRHFAGRLDRADPVVDHVSSDVECVATVWFDTEVDAAESKHWRPPEGYEVTNIWVSKNTVAADVSRCDDD